MRAAAAEVDAVQAGVQLDAVAAALETVAVNGLQGVGRFRRESARQREGEEERKMRKGERGIEEKRKGQEAELESWKKKMGRRKDKRREKVMNRERVKEEKG